MTQLTASPEQKDAAKKIAEAKAQDLITLCDVGLEERLAAIQTVEDMKPLLLAIIKLARAGCVDDSHLHGMPRS